MHTIRLVPLIFLVACSLEIRGTSPRVLSVDASVDPADTLMGESDAGYIQPCADFDSDAGCPETAADAARPIDATDASDAHDAGSSTPGTCDGASPGSCGCGALDSDGDGHPDCEDGCPADPNKRDPQVCGCGSPEVDEDQDGIVDCVDACISSAGGGGAEDCACDPSNKGCGNQPPTVSLVEPSSDTVQVLTLSVSAVARDTDGSIRGVTLYIDGEAFREERGAPYEWGAQGNRPLELTTLAEGKHVLMVEAVDDKGATAQSARDITIVP